MKNVPHEEVVGTLDNFRDMVAPPPPWASTPTNTSARC
jgi:hypothetical protein